MQLSIFLMQAARVFAARSGREPNRIGVLSEVQCEQFPLFESSDDSRVGGDTFILLPLSLSYQHSAQRWNS